jgi:hypothetical protein
VSACDCGRPLVRRPGDLYETCAECRNLSDSCDCPQLEVSDAFTGDPFDPGPEPPPEDESEIELVTKIAASYTPVDWRAAFNAQPDDVDWLFGEFLERGTLSALFAKPGTGKSLIALEIAVTLVRAGHVVVYIDEENAIRDLVERLQAFGCDPAELDRLKFYSFARLPPLDSPEGGFHLSALAIVHRPALVVIDTATRMIAGRENDSDTFLALYRCSLAPLKARGITVLRLDHPGKDAGRGQRGSSAKDDDVDNAWRMITVADGLEYQLQRTKRRNGHGPGVWTLRRRYGPVRHDWEPADERNPGDAAKIAEILSTLTQQSIPLGAGRPAVRRALNAAGVAAGNHLLDAAIRRRKALSKNAADSPDSSAQ